MEILSRKLSVITAIVALLVTVGVGLAAGVAWEVTLMRGLMAFLLIMVVSLFLFRLALIDRPDKNKGGE